MQPPAVLPGVALLADARAVDALSLPRAVVGTPQLGAVLSGETLLTDAFPVHAEPVGAAASGAAELGAVLTPIVVVADALALQADATAGAAPGAAGLGAVAACPALHADTAAGLQAEVPVAAALWGVIQLPCKEVGPRVRAHPVGGGKKVSVDGLWGKGTRCGTSRGRSSLWVRTPSSGELVALGVELVIWAYGGAWGLPRSFSMAMGSISLVGVQVLPLVFLQISTQLMGTSLDLLLGKSLPWPSPLHQPCLLLSPLHPLTFLQVRFLFTCSLSPIRSRYVPKDIIFIPVLVSLSWWLRWRCLLCTKYHRFGYAGVVGKHVATMATTTNIPPLAGQACTRHSRVRRNAQG